MSEKTFIGEIRANIIEIRFALSGKVERVTKRRGDTVKKGELIACLDRKILQAELDKQLADFEKVRAEFEIFNLQKGEPQDDLTKYLKVQKQAQLNVSVKEVELAKAKLDQADLFSPVEGIVIEDSQLMAGIYITPSSNPVKILEPASYFFIMEIKQDDLPLFTDSRPSEVRFPETGRVITGITRPVVPSEKGFFVEIDLQEKTGLLLGLKGEAVFSL